MDLVAEEEGVGLSMTVHIITIDINIIEMDETVDVWRVGFWVSCSG